ncbi:Txe/YoeB family addiction module toxin [Nocardia spumae]|uniref:Txe/YoeB family addiction module toxin n=1 Tax=Nocardia spumae TaxID=2887190 RepID=UPI001D13B03A|nr:Txe/YoeB family addiction module toxin [Nocardia spumae]
MQLHTETGTNDVWTVANDRAAARTINRLFDDIAVTGHADGIGQPEPLPHHLSGWWSRRITQDHRLVYRVEHAVIHILSCHPEQAGNPNRPAIGDGSVAPVQRLSSLRRCSMISGGTSSLPPPTTLRFRQRHRLVCAFRDVVAHTPRCSTAAAQKRSADEAELLSVSLNGFE